VLIAPGIVAIYLGDNDYFTINDTFDRMLRQSALPIPFEQQMRRCHYVLQSIWVLSAIRVIAPSSQVLDRKCTYLDLLFHIPPKISQPPSLEPREQ
jgi:hypothetical protein